MVVTFQLVGSRVFCVACSALMPQAAHHIGVRARVGCASPVTPSRVPKASTPQQRRRRSRAQCPHCPTAYCLYLQTAGDAHSVVCGSARRVRTRVFATPRGGCPVKRGPGAALQRFLPGPRTGGHARGHGLLVLLLLHLSHVGVLLLGANRQGTASDGGWE